MNSHPPKSRVKGWCPGALRPMPSGDGLIVRLKPPLGIVDTALAVKVARWSHQWGNGVIELSARANLQLRGVASSGVAALQSAMSETLLLDDDMRAEAVRNIVLSPLSDVDPDAILDLQPAASALDRALRLDTRLHDLPAKFGFAIDDGGGFATSAADVTFVACRTQDGVGFAIGLAGAPGSWFGPCAADRLAEVAVLLGLGFLAIASRHGCQDRRMRDLVACTGAATIAKAAGLEICSVAVPPRPAPANVLGPHPIGAAAFVGVGLPFGQINATDFADLALSAAACGARDLRLTPYRAIFVTVPSPRAALQLVNRCTVGGFIIDPADPRRRVAACPGAPGCLNAAVPARADAAVLAPALADIPGSAMLVHISGCEKGCAHPAAAPVTLTGRDGFYDLVLNGIASAEPVLRRLTLGQALDVVAARTESAFR